MVSLLEGVGTEDCWDLECARDAVGVWYGLGVCSKSRSISRTLAKSCLTFWMS